MFLSLSIFTCCFSENQEEIDDSIEIEGNWLVYNGTTFNQMIELSNGSMKLYGCTNLPDGECDVVFWRSFDGDRIQIVKLIPLKIIHLQGRIV